MSCSRASGSPELDPAVAADRVAGQQEVAAQVVGPDREAGEPERAGEPVGEEEGGAVGRDPVDAVVAGQGEVADRALVAEARAGVEDRQLGPRPQPAAPAVEAGQHQHAFVAREPGTAAVAGRRGQVPVAAQRPPATDRAAAPVDPLDDRQPSPPWGDRLPAVGRAFERDAAGGDELVEGQATRRGRRRQPAGEHQRRRDRGRQSPPGRRPSAEPPHRLSHPSHTASTRGPRPEVPAGPRRLPRLVPCLGSSA